MSAPDCRKIVQIATAGAEWGAAVIALCDDGTVWTREFSKGEHARWDQVPSIPQDGRKAAP